MWAKVTEVAAPELKKCLSEGMGFGEICGAVVVARKQGKSFAEVVEKAKADKVNIRTLAYAIGITMDELAAQLQALHRAFLEQAAADGLVSKEQAQKAGAGVARRELKPGQKVLPAPKASVGAVFGFRRGPAFGFGPAWAGMPGFAGERAVWMRWRNMIRGAGAPSAGK